MEIAFDAIGLEIVSESAFNDLAEDVGRRGEISFLPRKSGVLHGRCLKFGAGLEVWTLLYESGRGEVVYADCRPGFRARYAHRISPWMMTELAEEGAAVVHGFVEDTETEVLFQLQNLTEVGGRALEEQTLRAGLCGLAYRAEVLVEPARPFWRSFDEIALNVAHENENDWSLCGRVIAFDTLRNPLSGNDLYWIYVDLGLLRLEITVSPRALAGEKLAVGVFLEADVWLQGHILTENARRSGYEGVDRSARTVDFWTSFKKPN